VSELSLCELEQILGVCDMVQDGCWTVHGVFPFSFQEETRPMRCLELVQVPGDRIPPPLYIVSCRGMCCPESSTVQCQRQQKCCVASRMIGCTCPTRRTCLRRSRNRYVMNSDRMTRCAQTDAGNFYRSVLTGS
jgi:hypothetical protein